MITARAAVLQPGWRIRLGAGVVTVDRVQHNPGHDVTVSATGEDEYGACPVTVLMPAYELVEVL